MKKTALLLFILAYAALAADRSSGGMAGAYQRMPQDARSAAMGNGAGAVTNDINAIFDNPALTATLSEKQVSSNVEFLSLDRSLNSLSFGLPVKPSAGIAFVWQHAGVGNIQGRDFANNPTEIYSSSQDVFIVSFANNFSPDLSVGIATKIMMDKLQTTSASGLGIDAGISWRPMSWVSLAASARDLKSDVTWDTEKLYEFGGRRVDKLPTRYLLSLAIQPASNLTFSGSWKGSQEIFPTWHAGMEYVVSPLLQMRAGLDDGMPALGFGMEYHAWKTLSARLDYAFLYGRASEGAGHLFSMQFFF